MYHLFRVKIIRDETVYYTTIARVFTFEIPTNEKVKKLIEETYEMGDARISDIQFMGTQHHDILMDDWQLLNPDGTIANHSRRIGDKHYSSHLFSIHKK